MFPVDAPDNRCPTRGGDTMTPRVAVIAHAGKTFGGGLAELRKVLADCGIDDPIWHEVPKSRRAPKQVRRAVEAGAELVLAWGGDGMVQQCADTLVGTDVELAILPAGTANLLATNLGIPHTIDGAVDVALHGTRRALDLGRVNGEHFAVMAGAGFDAAMIHDADRGLKDRVGRAAYLWSGAKNVRRQAVRATVDVDGARYFDGPVGCVLVGNVGSLFGGVTIFEQAAPDDGRLDLAVVSAENMWQWASVLARAMVKKHPGSRHVQMTQGKKIRVRFDAKVPYELDGGDRPATDRLKIRVRHGVLTICVPKEGEG